MMRAKAAQVLPLARISGNHPCWVTRQRTAPLFNHTQSSLKSHHVTVAPSATRKPESFFPLLYNKAVVLGRFFCFPCSPYHISFPPSPMPLSPLPLLFIWLGFAAFPNIDVPLYNIVPKMLPFGRLPIRQAYIVC